MKCADPKLCYTDPRTGTKILRHFSLASYIFKKKAQRVFDCGTCLFCRRKRSYELACRCVLHASLYKENCFLTLTYDETLPTYHNNFQYKDIQDFKKRLRDYCRYHFNKKIEVFNVHEYGKNGKKHWHLIVFNHDFSSDRKVHTYKKGIPLYTSLKLSELWPYGFNTIGSVTEASAMYQSQYTQKDFKNGNVTNDRKSDSQHSGIAKPYFLKHYKQILQLGYVPVDGKKMPLPRYFEKIAHKHYSHFYEPSNFFDYPHRKKLYTPFKQGMENKEIADLYIQYKNQKDEKIKELEKEWNELLELHFQTGNDPDFIQSAKNTIYDLKNKTNQEIF